MLLFSALVAGSFSLGVRAANLIEPSAISAARLAIAAGLLGGLALAGPGLPRTVFAAPWRYLVVGGLFAAYFVLMFEGLKTAPVVSASAVFTLTPIITAACGWWLMRQRTTRRMAAALTLGGAGALWVIFRGDPAALMRLDLGRGEAIYLIGCVAHALYTPMVRHLNRGERPLQFAFGTLSAAALMLVIWDPGALTATAWLALPAIVWVTLIYIAVFATAGTAVLLQFAALHLPAAKVMAYTYLTPVWVIAIEAALGQGVPVWSAVPGICAIIAALVLLLKE
ncbi:MAG: DMT family transporter [Paracoccus sp. (in: a-proteobacteria)]|uniref:DMT family transporter n=1 Tax=Paracoccus sp. TaxID=267 RepID=UPI0026DF3793|nr:DMT family transporter [Paracoccus sp. (in: a-proteobacteria)]MDO5612023.1 DMT family transporter [Paracoccus sp. (in: a-proteobacteria)]